MKITNQMMQELNTNGYFNLSDGNTLYKGEQLRESMCDFVQVGMHYFEIKESENNDIYLLKNNFECEKVLSFFILDSEIFSQVKNILNKYKKSFKSLFLTKKEFLK